MKYAGIFKLAYKLLVNDRGKFSALLLGITFAVFLMVMMTSLFAGILSRSASTVTNVGASMWVMDPAVQTVASSIPMPGYVLDAVRSIDGVHYAVPLYSGGALVKLRDGKYQAVSVMGLDDTSLVGRPRLEQGNIEDIYADNGFIVVDDAEYGKLGSPVLGQEFELNDNRGVVVGIARVNSFGLFGIPTLYTTYSRAIEYIPGTRFTISPMSDFLYGWLTSPDRTTCPLATWKFTSSQIPYCGYIRISCVMVLAMSSSPLGAVG